MNIISYLINYDYIYPLAWEDPRVDNEVLNINENDNILGITTGGDNILNYLVHNPNKIITCDFNCHQNYLLDMKMSAIINLSQNDYY
jgi:S-adenosylmethionine:diacylglycerol 3-amino-3-carboxypropyl transferase